MSDNQPDMFSFNSSFNIIIIPLHKVENKPNLLGKLMFFMEAF